MIYFLFLLSIINLFLIIWLFLKEKKVYTEIEDRGSFRAMLPIRKIILANFLGGMAWGLGVFLGATILVAILVFLLESLAGIPFIQNIINVFTKQ